MCASETAQFCFSANRAQQSYKLDLTLEGLPFQMPECVKQHSSKSFKTKSIFFPLEAKIANKRLVWRFSFFIILIVSFIYIMYFSFSS